MTLEFELLDPARHDRQGFTCGVAALDRYLQEQASQDIRRYACTIFVLVKRGDAKILGYYTLANTILQLEQNALVEPKILKNFPKYPLLPATLIGRLARYLDVQGMGYGELLLMDALRKSLRVARTEIGSVAVVVDALNERAMQFYLRYGFVGLSSNSLRLFLPMLSVAKIFE